MLYSFSIILFACGLYITLASQNRIKKLFGLGIFQNSVLWFYITLAKVENAVPPIIVEANLKYSNPLPHVLMLTAIVVGVATLSLGIALIIKIENPQKQAHS